MASRKHISGTFEDFLRELGRLNQATAIARERVPKFGCAALRKALKGTTPKEDVLGPARGREVL